MDNNLTTIAKRYARALFETYDTADSRQAALDQAETILAVLGPELEERLAKPAVSSESKRGVLKELFKSVQVDTKLERTLYLLWENKRLAALRPFLLRLTELLDEALGMQRVEYQTARELAAGQQDRVQQNLEGVLGKKVRLSFSVNASLQAGCIVRVGYKVIDMSLKTRIGNLREAISQGV
jgi:F-type H+-transporting ATPase subunit delta